MANTFKFDTTTGEQVTRDVANRSVCVEIAVSIRDIDDSALQALPYVRVFGKQGRTQIHGGAFLVERRGARFLYGGVNQVEEGVEILIGEQPTDVTSVVG